MDFDVSLKDAMNGEQVASWMAGSGHARQVVVAMDVHDCRFSVTPGVPVTTLVCVQFTVGEGDKGLTLRSAAALRADMTDCVRMADGDYVLVDW